MLRMLLAQLSRRCHSDPEKKLLEVYNDTKWDLSKKIDEMCDEPGSKNPKNCTVDCSGWIAFLNRAALSSVNGRPSGICARKGCSDC